MTFGLFGGTFDPIHLGHLDVARAARRTLGLREVWIVPSRLPPHRGRPSAPAAHRFAMAALAAAGEPGLLVSDLEMDTDGPSYTTETLDRLEARGMATRAMCFITGADAFLDIRSWKDYPRLLDRCHFAVVSRPGVSAMTLPDALPELASRMAPASPSAGLEPRVLLVDAPTAPVASTDVRRAIAAGAPLAGLVPSAVAVYIERHHLYAPSGGAHLSSEDSA
jgi:nicotinate-nucleotide adenylyltransferase